MEDSPAILRRSARNRRSVTIPALTKGTNGMLYPILDPSEVILVDRTENTCLKWTMIPIWGLHRAVF
jgi:hypothetical protein